MSTYRGVKIYQTREEIPGSSLKELKDGTLVPCKSKFYPAVYRYAGSSYPYDSLREIKTAIENIYQRCLETWAESRPEEFAAVMNDSTQLTDERIFEILKGG